MEIHELPRNFANFDRNSRKTVQVLQNSGIPQDFESAGFGILQKLLLSSLEILKFLGIQFSVAHRGGGGKIFSGVAHSTETNRQLRKRWKSGKVLLLCSF